MRLPLMRGMCRAIPLFQDVRAYAHSLCAIASTDAALAQQKITDSQEQVTPIVMNGFIALGKEVPVIGAVARVKTTFWGTENG